MARLTSEQMAFLIRHKIPLSKVFDATGFTKGDYQEEMRRQDRLFAFGVSPCEKAGHTLRTRAGHCAQCGTAKIAFMMRQSKPADVYIAASRSKGLIKIGSSTELERRIGYLSMEAYGGADDWICVAKVRCEKAGAVEFTAQQKLRPFSFPATYVHDGHVQETYELFACSYQSARIALKASTPEAERPGFWERPDAMINYSFPDRRGG